MTLGRFRIARLRVGDAPLAVQIGALLMLSLIVAQAASLLVVVLSPPPPIPVYDLGEVARALQGGSLDARAGPRLIRSTSATPPASPTARQVPRPLMEFDHRRQLALMIGAPEDRVRFIWTGPPRGVRFSRLIHGEFRRGGQAHVREVFETEGPPPWAGMAPMPPPRRPPAGRPNVIRFGAVLGDFVAALRQPDGRWTVVRTPPHRLFSSWHERMLIWLLACLLVVGPAAWLFARRITAPIDGFARAAQALGRDPNAPPMPVSGPAEISAAAHAFNDMQARIRRYVDDRTAMVGAVSHDLRTPLARIRYKVENAPPELKAQVLSDVERMEQMIGSVLAFIREASEPRRRERLDLLSIVECVVDEAALPGGDAEIVRAEAMAVEGDGLALQRALTNLVDNAIKYGVLARVRMFDEEGEAVVEIGDQGPGLPEAELERVFEPFYRPGGARTLDDNGVGLGLSVARSIVRAHGGEVALRPADGGGLIASVRLPLA